MKLLFVRHAIALERFEWEDDDILRPLSDEGRAVARDFLKEAVKAYPKTKTIITSKAVRALQTTEILQQFVKGADIKEESILNPGADFTDLKKIIDKYRNLEGIYIVGHEPDFSEMISALCSDTLVAMKLKKPSLAEVKLFEQYKGELRALLQPKIFHKAQH